MKRLAATLLCDLRQQWRNGFYAVTAFLLVIWAVLATQRPDSDMRWLLPGMIIGGMVINTFYYIAALVLLEKGEGTLEALVVTPLRWNEYLASKLITLVALSVVENLFIAVLWGGFGLWLLPLVIGVVLASTLMVLAGFLAVTRYDSINEFLMPSIAYMTLILLPLLDAFRILKSPLFFLHPLQGALAVMNGGLQPGTGWIAVAGLAYAFGWIALLYLLCGRAFHRFVTVQQGAR